MNPPSPLKAFQEVSEKLMGLLHQENDLLSAYPLPEIHHLTQQKQQVAAHYAFLADQLIRLDLPVELKAEIRPLIHTLESLMKENERLISIALTSHHRILEGWVQLMQKKKKAQPSYTKWGLFKRSRS